MIEKHFILEEADPVIFYGANNVNIKMLRALCPKLRIMARDKSLKSIVPNSTVWQRRIYSI